MKRKLDSKYEDLVNYVASYREISYLSTIIRHFYVGYSRPEQILDDLNTDGYPYPEELDNLIPIIVDIYFDNYELEPEPKHMYCLLDIRSLDGPIYVTFKDECYTLSIYRFANDDSQSLTDKQFQEFLSQHPKFTADMFEKMEV